MSRADEERDWRVTLQPADPRVEEAGGGTLEIVHANEAEAVVALEDWAQTIESGGFVPEGLDWLNRSPATIVSRVGRRAFRARVDCFERETETGYSNGYAWLRLEEAHD